MQVRQLLLDPALRLRLAAGGRLEKEILWVATTEFEDVAQWVDGGELLLTTGANITGDEEHQRVYVRNLHRSGISALGFGTGRHHQHIPQGIIREANLLELPVLDVPPETPFIRITRSVFSEIVTERQRIMQAALAVHERLSETVITHEDSLLPIMNIVSDELGLSLELVDTLTGQQLASVAGSRSDAPVDRLSLPVTATDEPVMLEASKTSPLTDFDRQVLQHAKSSISFEFSRRDAVNSARLRLAGNLLSDLERNVINRPEFDARLGAFGIAPDAPFAAFCITDHRDDAQRNLKLLSRALGEMGRSYIASTSESSIALLLRAEDDAVALRIAQKFRHFLPRVQIGVGRVTSGLELGLSITEARMALLENPDSAVTTFKDLNSMGPLLSVSETALKLYVSDILGNVPDHPKLMESVHAFANHNGRWATASAALQVHRHTLRYRMNKVKELTGLDPDNPEDRMQIWLAVKAMRVLRIREASSI